MRRCNSFRENEGEEIGSNKLYENVNGHIRGKIVGRKHNSPLQFPQEAFAKLATFEAAKGAAKGRAPISTKPIMVTMGEERSEQTPSRHELKRGRQFCKSLSTLWHVQRRTYAHDTFSATTPLSSPHPTTPFSRPPGCHYLCGMV